MCRVVQNTLRNSKWLTKVSYISLSIPKISSERLKFQKALLIDNLLSSSPSVFSFRKFVSHMHISKPTGTSEVCQGNVNTMLLFVVTCETEFSVVSKQNKEIIEMFSDLFRRALPGAL